MDTPPDWCTIYVHNTCGARIWMESELLRYRGTVNWYKHLENTILALSSTIKDVYIIHDWAIPLQVYILENFMLFTPRNTHKTFQTNLVWNSKEILAIIQVPINSKMDKLWYSHTMKCYVAVKLNKLLHASTWMNLRNYAE